MTNYLDNVRQNKTAHAITFGFGNASGFFLLSPAWEWIQEKRRLSAAEKKKKEVENKSKKKKSGSSSSSKPKTNKR